MKPKSDMFKFIRSVLVFVILLIIIGIYAFSTLASELIQKDEYQTSICSISSLSYANGEQTFSGYDHNYYLSTVELELAKRLFNQPQYDLDVYITDPGETVIYGHQVLSKSDLTTSYQWHELDFSEDKILIEHNKSYEIFIAPTNPITDGNVYYWRYQKFGDTYVYGEADCDTPLYTGAGDFNFRIYGEVIKPDRLLSAFIPTAYATTTCSFVTDGTTTTASCSDAIIDNPSSNVFYGLVLFLAVFFGMVMYFKKK